ncbi:MAG: hypothetical protein H6828_11770 [Planctomycetes bacterium]|nr:hypothetical protein [Planctomycetota bacterium]
MTADALVLGLDLGTGGARALAVALDGTLEARGAALASVRDGARHEGDPEAWWAAARAALAACTAALAPRAARASRPCVDGTSGTLVGLDAAGRCTTPGLMYDDARRRRGRGCARTTQP